MPIRKIETFDQIKPWLPSDLSKTGWDQAQIQDALDDGHDPRLIAAEVWEEYAYALPTETDGSEQIVKSWTNIDVQVEYGTALSARDVALRQARFHRSRAKVRSVRFANSALESQAPQREESNAPR